MITVISGTNRKNSECFKFAKAYADILCRQTSGTNQVRLLALEQIPHDWFYPDMYNSGDQADSLAAIQDDYMIPAQKFVFVTPEYNGSYPGVVKLFLDACSVRDYRNTFKNKKAALLGIATGRAGNLRGMEHLTGVLNHVGTIVMPNRLPISKIESLTNGTGKIEDEHTLQIMEKHAKEFLSF